MKPTVQTSNRFLFLTGNEDFTIRKTAAAKIARARGQRFFVHICKRHGASEHYSSCMACVECQKQWYRDNGKHKPDPDIKPFISVYPLVKMTFRGLQFPQIFR
ncbi:hypothetical protein ACY2PK_000458 [Klebsiella aerogenes]|nr:hypothetical protein [Mixta calida]HBY7497796.1 hypothetical protein [Klebsiella pneumoniae]HBY7554259.1 hypothetical protein [Klebsiella pneumoniae]HCL6511745.1 hypothetical protein [Klebsiella pneumoniae]HED1750097.1 hypothetical protein [Klebsiella pneumoniae]